MFSASFADSISYPTNFSITIGGHILFPVSMPPSLTKIGTNLDEKIILNPWLMIFSF